MAKVLFIAEDEKKIDIVCEALRKNALEVSTASTEEEIFSKIREFFPDLILLDVSLKNTDITILAKKIKINTQTDNIIFSLLVPQDCDNQELLKTASSYVSEPINEKILLSTIMSSIRMKNSLDVLAKNNADLAKSLYQLDVLYNTSTQFSGSLDKEHLVDIMLEGLDKSLSFNLSYTLLFNNDNDIKLIINSLHPLSERFEQAVKLRAMISYKSLFDKKQMPYVINPDFIELERRIKHPYIEYDLPVLNYDSMFAPITVGEKFFGVIEVFREEDFKSEDATCFQTLSKQVSIPLETAVLYEEIKQTNAKLENLERMKSEFISIVSHELRTPLTAIKNSLSILQSGSAGERTPVMDKFLGLAERNVLRLKGIINDLLDLSKIEAGKMKFSFETASILTPIEAVKNTLENLIKEKNIHFFVNAEPDLPKVFIDPLRIEQVVTNLLSNAIKFTPEEGEIAVDVKLKKGSETEQDLDENRSYIVVSVRDSGIGIEEENLSKVFDKFQQIESSLSRKIGGTGLGLPIAKQLVDNHKGSIWVESVVNKGSVFSFAIPVFNENEVFEIDLEKQIAAAKTSNYQIGVIKIKETERGQNSFLEDILLDEINLVRKSANVKEYRYKEDGAEVLCITVMQMDRFALNFVGKKIDGFVNSGTKYQKCAILFSTALYPDDSDSAKEIIEKLDKNAVEVKF